MPNTMPQPPAAIVTALYRYPVKGLTPEPLSAVDLTPGKAIPFDRAFAIENGPGPFDPGAPRHLPKMHFVMLMRNEQLASVRARFDETTGVLSIVKDGTEQAKGDLATPEGRKTIEDVIAALVDKGLRGDPRIVSAPGHSFSDVADKCLHIINLESVRALEQAMSARIDPLRFRPNVIVDGWPAWSEFDRVGEAVTAGPATLEIFKRTERCAATNVDPQTGTRDLKIPSFLSRTFGHTDFGVYARVASPGTLRVSDEVKTTGRPIA